MAGGKNRFNFCISQATVTQSGRLWQNEKSLVCLSLLVQVMKRLLQIQSNGLAI